MAALTLTQDGTYYFDWHHTANDTFDKIDAKELAQNVAVYATWTYMAAQAEGDFGPRPMRSRRTRTKNDDSRSIHPLRRPRKLSMAIRLFVSILDAAVSVPVKFAEAAS